MSYSSLICKYSKWAKCAAETVTSDKQIKEAGVLPFSKILDYVKNRSSVDTLQKAQLIGGGVGLGTGAAAALPTLMGNAVRRSADQADDETSPVVKALSALAKGTGAGLFGGTLYGLGRDIHKAYPTKAASDKTARYMVNNTQPGQYLMEYPDKDIARGTGEGILGALGGAAKGGLIGAGLGAGGGGLVELLARAGRSGSAVEPMRKALLSGAALGGAAGLPLGALLGGIPSAIKGYYGKKDPIFAEAKKRETQRELFLQSLQEQMAKGASDAPDIHITPTDPSKPVEVIPARIPPSQLSQVLHTLGGAALGGLGGYYGGRGLGKMFWRTNPEMASLAGLPLGVGLGSLGGAASAANNDSPNPEYQRLIELMAENRQNQK